MAKELAQPPPSSSVAHLFDLKAAARAVANNETVPQTLMPPVNPPRTPSATDQSRPNATKKKLPKREVVLTANTDEVFSTLVELYRRATGTKLTASHVARAILKGAAHCMHFLEREARRIGPMSLPSNATGHELEREQFEARLADAFIAGIRASPAMDRDA